MVLLPELNTIFEDLFWLSISRYWYLEDIPDFDEELIKSVAATVHAAGEVLTWIPSYDGSAQDDIWKEARVFADSFATQS